MANTEPPSPMGSKSRAAAAIGSEKMANTEPPSPTDSENRAAAATGLEKMTDIKPPPSRLFRNRDAAAAPLAIAKKFKYIRNRQRRLFVSMTHVLDEEIGQLIDTLDSRQILNNTVIVFIADNGGMAEGHMRNFASNYPLRGQKLGPFEGGIRAVGIIWSPEIQSRHRISHQLMHTADWLPTLAAMASIELPDNLDGINLWPALSTNKPSPRTEILHNSNPLTKSIVYFNDGWKFIQNSQGLTNHTGWMGKLPNNETQSLNYFTSLNTSKTWPILSEFAEFHLNETKIVSLRNDATISCEKFNSKLTSVPCNSTTLPCLFHIPSDPCELHNLAPLYPEILGQIRNKINQQHPTMFPINVPGNTRSDPRHFNNTWTFWSDVIVTSEKFTEL
uniref:Sulfatase N-terminal domain-containing protein n=1 Tax=Phlebotomus papatasi TaxID=29031 RepID=A0A1B0CYF4_PHLPP